MPYFNAFVTAKKMEGRMGNLKSARRMYIEFLQLMRHY